MWRSHCFQTKQKIIIFFNGRRLFLGLIFDAPNMPRSSRRIHIISGVASIKVGQVAPYKNKREKTTFINVALAEKKKRVAFF
jgi:hypothetical protein